MKWDLFNPITYFTAHHIIFEYLLIYVFSYSFIHHHLLLTIVKNQIGEYILKQISEECTGVAILEQP